MKDGRMLEGVGQSQVLDSTTNAKEPPQSPGWGEKSRGLELGKT